MEDPKISTILIPPFLTILRKFFGFFFFLVLFWFLFPFLKEKQGREIPCPLWESPNCSFSFLFLQESQEIDSKRGAGERPSTSAPEEGEGADRKRAGGVLKQPIHYKEVSSKPGDSLKSRLLSETGAGPQVACLRKPIVVCFKLPLLV